MITCYHIFSPENFTHCPTEEWHQFPDEKFTGGMVMPPELPAPG
jgi:hypothetical protein